MKFNRDTWWEYFHLQHPGAFELVEFSRVGFNKDRTQALVYTGSCMNWHAGGGGYQSHHEVHERLVKLDVMIIADWQSRQESKSQYSKHAAQEQRAYPLG